jgi:hypothetical protein
MEDSIVALGEEALQLDGSNFVPLVVHFGSVEAEVVSSNLVGLLSFFFWFFPLSLVLPPCSPFPSFSLGFFHSFFLPRLPPSFSFSRSFSLVFSPFPFSLVLLLAFPRFPFYLVLLLPFFLSSFSLSSLLLTPSLLLTVP